MAKKLVGIIKLQIPSGKANPSPPVGPALGQRGLNIMEFCKSFNSATKDMESNIPIPVIISAYSDRSFSFETKTPPVSYFLRKIANLKKGSSNTGNGFIGEITIKQLHEIAKEKMKDLNAYDLDAASSMIEGSAKSMGFKILGCKNDKK